MSGRRKYTRFEDDVLEKSVTPSRAKDLELRNFVDIDLSLRWICLCGFDDFNGARLKQGSGCHLLTSQFFQRIGILINGFVLRPKVFSVIAPTHAERNVVIDLKSAPTGLTNFKTKSLVVHVDDIFFKRRTYRASAVNDSFRITDFIGVITNVAWSYGLDWGCRKRIRSRCEGRRD